MEAQLAKHGTDQADNAFSHRAADRKSGMGETRVTLSGGDSDPAEVTLPDVTGHPRDGAKANVSKPQHGWDTDSDGEPEVKPFAVPAFFDIPKQCAVAAAEDPGVSQDPGPQGTSETCGDSARAEQGSLPTSLGVPTDCGQASKQRAPKGKPNPRDVEDWMYSRKGFAEMNQAFGPFTLDAAASTDGENAQCRAFCSASGDSFLDKKLDGETIWANFPFGRADVFIEHYLEEKRRDPTNAGMFVLPAWKGATWWPKVQHMLLVKQHPKGEMLFTAPPKDGCNERTTLGPSPWPVCIFWDAPREVAPQAAKLDEDPRVRSDQPNNEEPSTSTQSEASSTMEQEGRIHGVAATQHDGSHRRLLVVNGRVNGAKAKILIDGGAAMDLAAAHFVKKAKLRTSPGPGGEQVELAGGQMQDASIVSQPVELQLDKWKCQRSFNVTELRGYDVILGKPWLASHNPQINWRTNVVQLWTGDRGESSWTRVKANAQPHARICQVLSGSDDKAADSQVTQGEADRSSSAEQPDVQTVSRAQMRKLARKKGAVTFVGTLSPSQPSSASSAEPLGQKVSATACVEPREQGGPCNASEQPSQPSGPTGSEFSQRMKKMAETEFSEVFEEPTGMPPQRDLEHRIELEGDARPSAEPVRRMSPLELDECQKQLKEHMERAHLRHSSSAWAAPVVFVRKKNGGLRMCIDYRRLNRMTRKDRYPMPRSDELFDQLNGAKFFTKLDLRSGYHQVRVAEDDIHKTAFRTKFGHFEFTVMPFGLTNAPATFQRMMNSVLAPFMDRFVVVYLDDILIYSRTEEEHEEHVRQVLQRLKDEKLRAGMGKCTFGETTTEYLGHIVGPEGISMDQVKVQAVAEWPVPQRKKELASFLGLAGYYRKFVEHYAQRAHPLSDLLKKDAAWTWEAKQQQAFEDIKRAMTTGPVLAIPDTNLPFSVYTDSSGFGTGAVLLQDQGNGLQPCAYLSHKLSLAERKYATHEQELLGIIHALKAWRPYLEGAHFKVNSDHKSLMELATQPKLSNRQARWVEFLQAYDCQVAYVPGERNPADALSRRPDLQVTSIGVQSSPGSKGGALTGRSPHPALVSATVHGTSCARCAKLGVTPADGSSPGSAHLCGGLGTSRARSHKLGSQPAVGSCQPAPLSRPPGTGDPCARGERRGSRQPHMGSPRPASCCGVLGTSCARSTKLRSSSKGGPASASPRLVHCAGGLGTSCVRSPKLKPEDDGTKVGLMNISVLEEDSSFLDLVRSTHAADAQPPRHRHLTHQDGLYYLGKRLYIPPPLRQHVVEELHGAAWAGHFGVDKTMDRVTRRFWWPHIRKVVDRVCRECASCQKSKPRSTKAYGQLQPIPVPVRPWQQITMDLVTDLPESTNGFTAVLVFVDRLTKMAHLVPTVKTLSAEGTAHLFKDHVFRYHGLPEAIIADRDKRWSGSFWTTVFRSLGTKMRLSTAYHPQTDGQTERMNRTMEEMLRSYVHPGADDWDQHLINCEFAYNTSKQRSSGRSPFYVAYGYQPKDPADLYNPRVAEDVPAAKQWAEALLEGHAAAKVALEHAQDAQRVQYDRRKARAPFQKGEWVLLEASHYRFQGTERHKISQPWLGPFLIDQMVGPNACRLVLPRKVRIHPTINVSRLRAYKGRVGSNGRPLELESQRAVPFVVIDAQETQVDLGAVESILSYRSVFDSRHRNTFLRREFLCKFAAADAINNAWLAQEQIEPSLMLKAVRSIGQGAIEASPAVYRKA